MGRLGGWGRLTGARQKKDTPQTIVDWPQGFSYDTSGLGALDPYPETNLCSKNVYTNMSSPSVIPLGTKLLFVGVFFSFCACVSVFVYQGPVYVSGLPAPVSVPIVLGGLRPSPSFPGGDLGALLRTGTGVALEAEAWGS